jgi:hypothetical protein
VKRIILCTLALSSLGAAAASAQTTTWYVLVPTIVPGVTATKVEMARSNDSLKNVETVYVPNNTSGIETTPTTIQSYIRPGGVQGSPLIDISAADAGGMMILTPVAGLDAVEVSFEVDANPIKTAWKLPLLTADQFVGANGTVFVQNLVKATDAASNLQLFNPGNLASTCNIEVLRPKGTTIEARNGITVPAMGVTLISDVLRKVAAPTATGINVAVSCNAPFYALSAYPATNRTETRVEYPVAHLPSNLTTVSMANRPGVFLNATSLTNASVLVTLPYDPTVTYHVTNIQFDAAVASPETFLVFWNIAGLFRHGGRRFDKTLFFGNFYNYDKSKYVCDVGSPYIETTTKYVFPLKPGNRYHWNITLDNDQQSNHYVITNGAGAVVMDELIGLYNPIETDDQGNQPTLQVGLNGIADNAYFPPVGWKFSNLQVTATASK